MQSLGMIKVEFSVEVRMAKKNEDGEMTHFDNYMKNEDRVIQNENDISSGLPLITDSFLRLKGLP